MSTKCINVEPDRDRIPYFIELQSGYVSLTLLRIVVPLLTHDIANATPRLHSTFTIDGRHLKLAVPDLFSIEAHALGPVVANLDAERDRIVTALDFLFTGV